MQRNTRLSQTQTPQQKIREFRFFFIFVLATDIKETKQQKQV